MLQAPAYRLEIAGRDVTRDLHDSLNVLTYIDRVEGASDELTVALEDRVGRFREKWYPTKGDKLKAWIGDATGLTPCGAFEIESLSYAGPPDVLTIRALATGPGSPLRTLRHLAYEAQQLRQLAQAVAGRNGLRVVGTVPAIKLDRLTQDGEHDLQFLAKVAADYGLAFSVKGDQLVFTSLAELEAAPAILTLDRADLASYSFDDNLVGVYKAAELAYHQPKTKKSEKHAVTARDGEVTSGDTLRLRKRVENREQAQALAAAALHRANGRALTGDITLTGGNRRLVAGVNFYQRGLGHFSGKWHATETTHTIDRGGGHTTQATIKRVW